MVSKEPRGRSYLRNCISRNNAGNYRMSSIRIRKCPVGQQLRRVGVGAPGDGRRHGGSGRGPCLTKGKSTMHYLETARAKSRATMRRTQILFSARLGGAVFVYLCMMLQSASAGELGAAGDLYVSGFSSNNIVQFDGETGAYVGEFVTSAAGGLGQPAGLAFGPNGNLFVCSFRDHYVREFDGTTGAFIRDAIPGTQTQESGYLQRPWTLLFTQNNRMLVCGYYNDAVLVYDATTFEWLGTWVGGPSGGGLDAPAGIALAPDGSLLVTAGHEDTPPYSPVGGILQYHATTGRFQRMIASGYDQTMWGLQVAPNGSLWAVTFWGDAATQSTGKLLQLDSETGQVVTSSDVNRPRGVLLAPDGNVLVARQNQVLKFDGTTGQLIGQFATGPLTNAQGMAFKPFPADATPAPTVTGVSTGNLDTCDGVVSVTVTGSNLDPAQTTVLLTAAGEPGIAGVVTGGDSGELTVSFDLGAGIAGGPRDVVVRSLDGQSATLAAAIDVAPCFAGRDTNLFVLGYRHRQKTRHGLFEYNGATGDLIGFVFEDLSGDLSAFYSRSLVFGHDGNILITSGNPWPGSVLSYDGVTGRKLGTFIPAGVGGMLLPRKLAFGPNGNLFVLHIVPPPGCGSGVLEFDGISGEFMREVVAMGTCGLACASDFAISDSGDIYITEWDSENQISRVFHFDGHTGECVGGKSLIEGLDPAYPNSHRLTMELSPVDGTLVFPWSTPGGVPNPARVTTNDPQTGQAVGMPIAPPAGGITQASASCFGPNGNLYVAGYPDSIFQYDLAEGTTLGPFAGQANASGGASANEIAFQPMLGDANGDWALDLRDFARMQECFGGDGVLPTDVNCLKLDYDRDRDVDAADGSAFVERMTGPQ